MTTGVVTGAFGFTGSGLLLTLLLMLPYCCFNSSATDVIASALSGFSLVS